MHAEKLTSRTGPTGATRSPSTEVDQQRLSKRIAIAVNLAKLFLLAALAPAAVTGIAQRASTITSATEAPEIVAITATVGSLCAVVGALALPALSDIGRVSLFGRWMWVLVGTCLGSIGLCVLATSTQRETLVLGWALAQLGYSGTMALLRVVLGSARPTHRRRGAVVAVIAGYAGMLIPLVILLFAPWAVWHTTFGLVLSSLIVPILFLTSGRNSLRSFSPVPATNVAQTDDKVAHKRVSPRVARIPLLVIQCCANVVMSIFLSFHALDIETRLRHVEGFAVRASVGVLIAAVVGLIVTSFVLLKKPQLLEHAYKLLILGALILAGSLALRGVSESLIFVAVAAAMSGIAVGLNSSTLLASALEVEPMRRAGRFIGLFSAAGAAGQFIGPMLGLWLLNALSPGSTVMNYQGMFVVLAALPLLWAALLGAYARVRARPNMT